MLVRTRDHSHVELLLREGKITEDEMPQSPDAQFRRVLPGRRPGDPGNDHQRRATCCEPGDVILLCTDGIWANLRDTDIAAFFRDDAQNCVPGSKPSAVAQFRPRRLSAIIPPPRCCAAVSV